MRLLLDSSGPWLVCALADGEGVIVEARHATGTPESRDIGAVAGRVLGELTAAELTAVVVGCGPGTFIGTRVALSYANGLAIAGSVPLHPVSSLAAICAVYCSGRSVVLRDARRGEVYMHWPSGRAGSGVEDGCRLVELDGLARELVAAGIETVVLEEPQPGLPRAAETLARMQAAAGQAGARVVRCDGVPAEGLRRMQALAKRVEYAEPVYLRGFL